MAILTGAEPFLLKGGQKGILLVHGFTGSPSEMRLLGEYLNNKGYTVLAPRLCGHGTVVDDMIPTGWRHWYGSVEDGYRLLSDLCSDIAVVGLSMGGLLSLKLAAEYKVSKAVSLCAPIYITDKRLPLLPVYSIFRKSVPKKRKPFKGVDPKYSIAYDCTPLKSLSSLVKLIKHVDGLLPDVTVPLLVVQSKQDHTVRPVSATHIYDKVGSRIKRLVWLEKSGHIATLDIERDRLFEVIDKFLKEEEVTI